MNLENCRLENISNLNYSERGWLFCHRFNDFVDDVEPLAQSVMILCTLGLVFNALTTFLLTVSRA